MYPINETNNTFVVDMIGMGVIMIV